jgi:hypothetical protein
MNQTYVSAHMEPIENDAGDIIDAFYFCSSWCHRQHMTEQGRPYLWNGCHETPAPQRCNTCGNNI